MQYLSEKLWNYIYKPLSIVHLDFNEQYFLDIVSIQILVISINDLLLVDWRTILQRISRK